MPAVASTVVCSACGEPVSGSGACLACLLRAGLDETHGARSDDGASFGDFEIERRDDDALCELGRGAMGVTYRALDKVLHRSVALKVIELPTGTDSQRVRERFLREARAAAALRHANIAGVFQFGTSADGDRCYCAMELVEGETLEARVRREGPLSVEVALEIATQVAGALVAAAERGLVHRDLKPGNIMLAHKAAAAGKLEVKVIDFGLAKAAAGAAEMELTHGGFVGTPAFASPEQFAGEAIDARADIYALGATLWFALSGRLPFPGSTIEEIRERQKTHALPTEHLRARSVPECVIDLLRSCLAVDPSERPESARELIHLLERCRAQSAERIRRRTFSIAVATIIAAGAICAFFVTHPRRDTEEPTPKSAATAALPDKSIAVLPFRPLVPENRDPMLELGMADTLITKLSSSRQLVVPSLASVRRHGGMDEDPLAVGRALSVKSVLEGTVLRAGDSIRVTARLINVADGSSLWSGTFEDRFTGVFAVQDTISQKVAEALALHLSGEEQTQLKKRYTENIEAYQLYLTGLFHWNKLTPPELMKAASFFENAVAVDPGYALAYFGLAEVYRALAIATDLTRPMEIFPKAKAAAEKAVQLDESLAEPHSNLAMTHLWFDWDWAAAEREALRAIALNPNSAISHSTYAQVLSTVGRHAEAIPAAARGRALDPVSLIGNTREGAMLYFARRYDEARERLEKVLELEPNFWIANMYLAKVHFEQGRHGEALAAFTKAAEFSRGNSEATSMLGYFAGRTGDVATGRRLLEELTSLSATRFLPPYNVALVCAGLGEQNEALAWLEKAFEERDPRLTWLGIEPQWDPMRGNPRFVEMLRRLRLQ